MLQCLSPLMLWVRIPIRARCTTLCDKVYQWLAAGRWFSLGTPASSTNKTDCHDIIEILLKVVLNTIIFTLLKYEVDAHLLLHISNVPHSLHANPLAWSPVSYGILNPMVNPWYIDPPTHGILNPLPMVYRPPYPWYFDPPTHRILTPPIHDILTSQHIFWLEMGGGSIYHGCKSTPGSIYHGV
jgi:hypothetical protein